MIKIVASRIRVLFLHALPNLALSGIALIGLGGDVATSQGKFGGEEFGLTQQGLVEAIDAVESLIASCMNEAGFEYIAASYKTVRRGMTSDKSLPGYGANRFLDQFGFGITTLYTGLGPQSSEYRTAAQIGLGERNVSIFRNLSPADQVAYNRSLLGDNVEVTFAIGLEIEDFSATGGCTRKAITKVFTPEQMATTYLNPLDAAIDNDPRMIKALEKYARCMRAGGFNYNHEKEVEPDLRRRLYAITQGQPVQLLSTEAVSALKELQGYERALARVAVDCEERVLDPVADVIERELLAR